MYERFKLRKVVAALPVVLLTVLPHSAWAVSIETDNPDLSVRWDTTVGYAVGFRTKAPSAALTQGAAAVSFNDGDLNFSNRGRPITNRFDLFTEADVSYRNYGARMSLAAWNDDVYNTGTSSSAALATAGPFNQARTLNGGALGEFPQATRYQHGRKAELLDAFVFGKVDLGSVPVTARLGRHAVTWGETVFFGGNGIAAGMAPVDLVKLQSSPNSTVKETTRPVSQLSAQAVIAPGVSVAGYYQLKYEKSRSAGVGSFYSGIDTIDTGGDRSLLVTPGGLAVYNRIQNQEPSDTGQFGVSTNFNLPSGVDVGLHAIQYTSKAPYSYAYFAGVASPTLHTYQLVYPEKIRAYAASFSTTASENITVAGEAGVRTNMPLTRGLIILPNVLKGAANATDNSFYPTGNTAHLNLSTTVAMNPNFVANEAIFLAEFAWNRVLACTKNCVNIPAGTFGLGTGGVTTVDGNAERDAYGFRLLYSPTYRQIFSGVDLTVPIGLSYSPKGKSGAVAPLFVDKGGDLSLGVTATIRSSTTVALRYTHYYGPEDLPLNTAGFFNFAQTLKDRNNITLSMRHSF
jgi:Protein of unknown function (DUF1302)